MASNSHISVYYKILQDLMSPCNKTSYYQLDSYLRPYKELALELDSQDRFVAPMPWIGMYIALASLFCVLAIVADLLHGFRNRNLWFPCKYFTLNAASLTIIAVAMKLPVDLSNPMLGTVDRYAKVGSMAFMCTMMANLLPSLAIMGNKELFANIIAMVILVITLVVNVCIQIKTGLISHGDPKMFLDDMLPIPLYYPSWPETLYVAFLVMLLMIHLCSSLAIVKSKQILESKYRACHKVASNHKLQQTETLTVEMLTQHVSNYWIMAATGSPQFMIACFSTTAASGVICALSSVFHINFMANVISVLYDYQSDYKWSTLVILITQFCGAVLGSFAPISRCLASLSYELSMKWFWNHINVFKVESYWTQKLSDWKRSGIPFPIHSRVIKTVIRYLKDFILTVCIGFQKAVVVACKMIGLVSIFFLIWFSYFLRCWKWLKSMLIALGIVLGKGPKQLELEKDFSRYVLRLEDDMEFAERSLKGILKSVNRLIQKGERQQPKNLMKLLEKSGGFEGVEMLNCHHVPPLLTEDFHNCWSLPLVTLTTIVVSLPNIPKDVVNWLLRSMNEGLVYVTLVEETLNASDQYENMQKAAKALWVEVEDYHRWLGTKLQQTTSQLNATGQILRWFRDKAKKIVSEVESTDIENDSIFKYISAYSMYRITEAILVSLGENIEQVSQEELFERLSSMISDILFACLTNLPQVIAIKCQATAIEKRVESVQAAAQLLGETTKIINHVQNRALPSLEPDDLAFIDNWCAYLKHSSP